MAQHYKRIKPKTQDQVGNADNTPTYLDVPNLSFPKQCTVFLKVSALVLDGASAFPRVLSPFVSHYTPSCFSLLDGVSAFPRVLSPFVSHCTSSCFPLLMVSFLRLSEGLVSPLSPIVPLLVSLGWCVRLSQGPVSLCLPLYAFLFPFVGWRARLPEGLVSLCLPFCPCLLPLDGASTFLRVLSPIVPLLGFPLLDGVSAFPRAFSPFVFHCTHFLFPFVGWCVRLPEVLSPLVSHCLPACFSLSLLDSVSGFPNYFPACPPAGLPACLPHCFPLLDGVSAFPRLCLSLSPSFSSFLFPFVGWCVRLPEALSPLVSHRLPACFPLLDGVSVFPRPCLPLSPIVSLLVSLCCTVCVRLPGALSPCFPSLSTSFACLPACLPSCFPLLDDVPTCLPACYPACLPALPAYLPA